MLTAQEYQASVEYLQEMDYLLNGQQPIIMSASYRDKLFAFIENLKVKVAEYQQQHPSH